MSVISGCDAAPVFKAPKEPLDDVSSAIDPAVERIWRPTRGGGWDDGLDVSRGQPVTQAVGIIGFIGEQPLWWNDRTEQRDGHSDVGDIAWCQGDGDRSAAIIGQAMDLAGPPAPRAADRFFMLPLFEPAAERWALTWLLSIDSSWGTGPDAAIFSNRRCQMRRWDQRL